MGLLDKVAQFTAAKELQAAGIYPYFRVIESAQENTVRIDGKEVIMLGSNNYLGLTNHPKVKEAAKAAIDKYGSGCTGSRFLNGTLDIHIELEEKLARLVGKVDTGSAMVVASHDRAFLRACGCRIVDLDAA